MWRKRDLKGDGGVSSTSTSGFPAGDGDGEVDRGEEDEEDFDWIQELDDSRVDWLFI